METNKYGFKEASNKTGGLVYRFFCDIADKGEGVFKKDLELIKQSKTSFAFKDCPGTVFGLVSPSFCNAFHEVTSGEGSEKDKINTLHSSSLLGLLTFYKMKEPGSHININIEGIDFTFDKVVFEKTWGGGGGVRKGIGSIFVQTYFHYEGHNFSKAKTGVLSAWVR